MGSPRINRYHDPLCEGDSEASTVGCRHTNADICAKNAMDGVCAFVRSDGMCIAPPVTWPKQYRKLFTLAGGCSVSSEADG